MTVIIRNRLCHPSEIGGIVQYVNLQSRVPRLMKEQGIQSAAELARRSGLGYATCWRIAKAGDLPSRASTIAALATALNVQPGDLFKAK